MLMQTKKSSLFKKVTRGITIGSVFTGNTLLHSSSILALGLTKLVKPSPKIDETNVNIANNWLTINNWLIDHVLPETQWDIRIDPNLDLQLDGRYIMTCNHQSWVDTTVNQYFGRPRMPLTRFFTKWELIFIPLVGQAFKILGFPMMKRHTKSQIAKNPELKHRDIMEARKSCEQLLSQPFTLLNYVEGTRFTAEKHAKQKSPYKHLLKAKAGGLALAIHILGKKVDSLVDMTIVYPDGVPDYSEFWLGEVPRIVVHLRKIDIPQWILEGNYEEDRQFRAQFYQWLSQIWHEKDALIDEIKTQYQCKTAP
ncbi:acyltransferase [Acinetobacter boissieri]|uniref:1-acyl-sn-glycerol-3-phosphate acyltransferase n=1 Tax=Acinetobacter boissieri TaxID=1219383 RepID=A0A1G6HCH9_9GAMM|nr:acyltransferase [Acinetobacter boissieri]SDB91982.1 1-acyl-sn-glycerol-3-phosphate acyltransferase [Acinetobacter boissieri]